MKHAIRLSVAVWLLGTLGLRADYSGNLTADDYVKIQKSTDSNTENDNQALLIGKDNDIKSTAEKSAAIGYSNVIDKTSGSGTVYGALALGNANTIKAHSSAAIGGSNTLEKGNNLAVGVFNTVTAHRSFAIGYDNDVLTHDDSGALGYQNKVESDRSFAVGAWCETAGQYGIALGYKAQALHASAFVWADSSSTATFASTAANEYSVRAHGGVRLETDGAGATVDGDTVLTTANTSLVLVPEQGNLSMGTFKDGPTP